MPEFKSDKDMSRGDMDIKSAKNVPIMCIKWVDNKCVHLLSSCNDSHATANVLHRVKGRAEKIAVQCPTVVQSYNKNMGGVDKHDRFKVAYEIDRRSQSRFYLRIVFDMFDQLLVNAAILYNSIDGVRKISNQEFRLHICRALCKDAFPRKRAIKFSEKQGKMLNPAQSRAESHIPASLANSNRRRCEYCKSKKIDRKAGKECIKCNVGLCLTAERNCFAM